MKAPKHTSTLLVLLVALFFLACTKNERLQIDNESQTNVDYVLAAQEFCNLPAIFLPHLKGAPGANAINSITINCVQFEYVSGDTVYFDPAPVYSLSASHIQEATKDGKERSGKIWLTLYGPYRIPGTVCKVRLEDYTAGGISYSCKDMSLTTVGESGNYLSQDQKVVDGQCKIGTNVFYFSGEHRISNFYAGGSYGAAPYYSLYGQAQGQSRTGLHYSAEVVRDVVKNTSCYCYAKGEIKLQPDGYQGKTLDFGEGECDDFGQFTINENTVAFKLK